VITTYPWKDCSTIVWSYTEKIPVYMKDDNELVKQTKLIMLFHTNDAMAPIAITEIVTCYTRQTSSNTGPKGQLEASTEVA